MIHFQNFVIFILASSNHRVQTFCDKHIEPTISTNNKQVFKSTLQIIRKGSHEILIADA